MIELLGKKMKSYTTYIFDLDGTITDTLVVWLGIFRDCLVQCGITPPDDKTLSQHTHDFRQMILLGLSEEKLHDFTLLAHKIANERLPKASFHVGAYEVLESIKNKGKNIAIFSSLDRPIFEPAISFRELNKLADVLIAGTDVPYRKPHPAGIIKALDDLNIPKRDYKNAVYIGDKDTDIQAAHGAGIDAILYYPIAHQLFYPLHELQKHNPEYIISDWQELLF